MKKASWLPYNPVFSNWNYQIGILPTWSLPKPGNIKLNYMLGGGLKHFLFLPLLREMIQVD